MAENSSDVRRTYLDAYEGRSYRSSREEAALKNRVAGAEENT